jgi:RNA polymerase sigma-70 factor (ECF subfamily)
MRASKPLDNLPSDAELLARIAHQDQEALSVLYSRYGNLVYSLAFHALQNASLTEEVTQDVFIKIWTHPTHWDSSKGKFSSWLLTITRYTAIDRFRREQHQSSRCVALAEDIAEEAEDEPDWIEDQAEELRRLLERLPVEQAQVIHLAYFQGMTHRQMAQALDLPIGTVKARLRLGLSKLKHHLMQFVISMQH